MALRQAYSAASTCKLRSFSTWSWKIRMLSINDITRSGDMWFEWIPAVAKRGATCKGIGHCAAFNTKSSLQTRRRRATWSVTARSGKNGMFLAHSTALKSNRAANSQIFSMPMMPQGTLKPCWKRVVGYGSARRRRLMNPERNEWPLATSPFTVAWGVDGCGTCVGGMRPLCTAVEKGEKVHSTYNLLQISKWYKLILAVSHHTFSSHADLHTLLKPTVLTLVAVMLVDRTIPRSSASVREISSHASLEERLASLTCKHPVVLAWWLVATNWTFDLTSFLRRLLLLRFGCFTPRLSGHDGHRIKLKLRM